LVMDHGIAEPSPYAATIDPPALTPIGDRMAAMERFIDGLCRTVGACGGCLVAVDIRDGTPAPRGWAAQNTPARAALETLLAMPGALGWRRCGWLRHAAAPDHCGLTMDLPTTRGGDRLLLLFADGRIDEADVAARVAALVPGLAMMADAVQQAIGDLEHAERRQRTMTAVLRQSECGLVAVRADHSVLFANAAAQAILADADGIERRRNMLRPTRYQDAVRFQAALDAVIATRRRGLVLLLERGGALRPLIAVVTPADGGDPAAGDVDDDAAAIVSLLRPESAARGLEPICQLHGLSPVETQIVAQLANGQTLAKAATRLRIKPDTARTYLKQVFAKTDTHRQAELLQLLLRYQRAVGGDVTVEAA